MARVAASTSPPAVEVAVAPPPVWHSLAAGGASAIVSRLVTCELHEGARSHRDSDRAAQLAAVKGRRMVSHHRLHSAGKVRCVPACLPACLPACPTARWRPSLLSAPSLQTHLTPSSRGCRCRAQAGAQRCTPALATRLPRLRHRRWVGRVGWGRVGVAACMRPVGSALVAGAVQQDRRPSGCAAGPRWASQRTAPCTVTMQRP